ncbi:MATE family efflux transporter [Aquibacillus albus]|uniref:MATE family efflux protein n=1 Tax=Aquibacillus albus TaxID=1168171 RepID=A0ABS2N152_9BACI|nr:MATE family efflux transporter [Aquibacillus albus]MBM7571864.1 putative MATE family efflux protein [Aquibacillus albus]
MTNVNQTTSTLKKNTLFAITWPIFIEVSLQMLMRFSDVFMLSFVSDDAVAAIGVVNQIMGFTFVLFNFTAMGSGVVVSQYVGAKKPKEISDTVIHAIVINLLFGIFISSLIIMFRYQFLDLFNLSSSLVAFADIYMIVVGGTLFTQAMVLTINSILQAKGFTQTVMYVAIGMNLLNILGNYLFIFGVFGVPQLGVTGVAISTAVCRAAAMVVLFMLLYRSLDVKIKWQDMFRLNTYFTKKIMKIGVPAAGEHLSYNTSQIIITVFITMLGATALATRVYTQNLILLITVFSMSISKGTQIYIGQLVGAGKIEEAYHQLFRSLKFALSLAIVTACLFALLGKPLFNLFTTDTDIIYIGSILLLIGIILEPGRTFNHITMSGLRASGDATFPMMMGIVSMWGISVPLSYLFGITLGYGLIGMWFAFVIDEWVRGIVMLFRWKSRKWEGMAVVERNNKQKEVREM